MEQSQANELDHGRWHLPYSRVPGPPGKAHIICPSRPQCIATSRNFQVPEVRTCPSHPMPPFLPHPLSVMFLMTKVMTCRHTRFPWAPTFAPRLREHRLLLEAVLPAKAKAMRLVKKVQIFSFISPHLRHLQIGAAGQPEYLLLLPHLPKVWHYPLL